MSDDGALVRPYVQDRLTRTLLVVWGVDATMAGAALVRGNDHAERFHFDIRSAIASHGPQLEEALLYKISAERFIRREVTDHAAWFLLGHDVVSPRDLAIARTTIQQYWAEHDSYADWFRRGYGYDPSAVTLSGERSHARQFPFPAVSQVVDRRSGPLPIAARVGPHMLLGGGRTGA